MYLESIIGVRGLLVGTAFFKFLATAARARIITFGQGGSPGSILAPYYGHELFRGLASSIQRDHLFQKRTAVVEEFFEART